MSVGSYYLAITKRLATHYEEVKDNATPPEGWVKYLVDWARANRIGSDRPDSTLKMLAEEAVFGRKVH